MSARCTFAMARVCLAAALAFVFTPAAVHAAPAGPSPAAFDRFDAWLSTRTRGAAPDAASGVALARERRAALARLIVTDPRSALARAIRDDVRSSLPADVREEMEQTITGIGELDVIAVDDFATR